MNLLANPVGIKISRLVGETSKFFGSFSVEKGGVALKYYFEFFNRF